jgi:LCP family protein required for cell wall assembly
MNCTEARKLIDRGVRPGSHPPLRARLGAHLSRCAACQAYQEYNEHLLNSLLMQSGGQASSSIRPTLQPAETRHNPPFPWKLILRLWGIVLGAAMLVLLVRAVDIAVQVNRDLDAMIIAPDAVSTPGAPAGSSGEAPDPAVVAASLFDDATATAWPTIEILPTVVPTVTPTPTAAPPPPGEPVTILLLGTDRRPDEAPDEYPRTDAIMLVRVDPVNERIALLSLPRDLWVTIPGGYYPNRVNNAYRFGEIYEGPGHGFQRVGSTVSHLLGIQIDYIAMIDFMSFIDLVDTLGGITIDVEKELYDDAFPTMDYGWQVVHFLPGPQQMDGHTALTYSRIRHPDSDFMRIRRQQTVMIGIGERLRERGDLHNLATLDQITGSLRDHVRTDMPKERIMGLVWAMRHYDIADVERYTVTEDMVTYGVGNDLYALVPIQPALTDITNRFMGFTTP